LPIVLIKAIVFPDFALASTLPGPNHNPQTKEQPMPTCSASIRTLSGLAIWGGGLLVTLAHLGMAYGA
jgi:hypothetical protein